MPSPFRHRPLWVPLVLFALVALIAVVALGWVLVAVPGGATNPGAEIGSEALPAEEEPEPPLASVTPTGPAPEVGAAEAPDSVLVLGDSAMADAAPAVVAMFEAMGSDAVDAARGGLGLSRMGFDAESSTFAEDWTTLVESVDPDLVVVMLGVWDGGFVEANGAAAYAELVEQAMGILTSKGAKVLWLSTPPDLEVEDRSVDHVFERVAAAHPGRVSYADIADSLRAPDGSIQAAFRTPDGSTVQLRKADGFHFCPDGAAALAGDIERLAVALGLGVPAEPAWKDGPWRGASVYGGFPECRARPPG